MGDGGDTSTSEHVRVDSSTRPGASRRALLRGASWSVPTAAVAAVAPAYEASQPDVTFGVLFDGGGGANGYLTSTYLDLGVAIGPKPFTLTAPLVLTIDVVGLNPNTTTQRSFTPSSSDGTIGTRAYNTATRTTTFAWTIPAGTVVPATGTATANPDILFSFGDGLSGSERITNKIVATSISGGRMNGLPIDSSVAKDVSGVSPDGID